jgi:hypothetical protein
MTESPNAARPSGASTGSGAGAGAAACWTETVGDGVAADLAPCPPAALSRSEWPTVTVPQAPIDATTATPSTAALSVRGKDGTAPR